MAAFTHSMLCNCVVLLNVKFASNGVCELVTKAKVFMAVGFCHDLQQWGGCTSEVFGGRF